MSQCNYCSYIQVIRAAKKKKLKVTKKPDKRGVNIYVHLRNVEPDHDKHFACWFMELPDRCCC